MNTLYIPFQQASDSIINDSTKRSRIIAGAVAIAVAAQMPLPTSMVESPSNFYNNHTASRVRDLLSRFNENVVFDLRLAVEQARAFWLLRYTAAHPITRPIYNLDYGFIDSVVQAANFIDAETHKFYNEHKAQVLFLASQAGDVLAAILASDQDH